MSDVPNRATFENAYAGKAPWDIGKPQAAFTQVADRVVSPVLNAGCGTGENALFFASLGRRTRRPTMSTVGRRTGHDIARIHQLRLRSAFPVLLEHPSTEMRSASLLPVAQQAKL